MSWKIPTFFFLIGRLPYSQSHSPTGRQSFTKHSPGQSLKFQMKFSCLNLSTMAKLSIYIYVKAIKSINLWGCRWVPGTVFLRGYPSHGRPPSFKSHVVVIQVWREVRLQLSEPVQGALSLAHLNGAAGEPGPGNRARY